MSTRSGIELIYVSHVWNLVVSQMFIEPNFVECMDERMNKRQQNVGMWGKSKKMTLCIGTTFCRLHNHQFHPDISKRVKLVLMLGDLFSNTL